MASIIKDALPARLKPSNGEAEGRHHGKTQSHVVSLPPLHFSEVAGAGDNDKQRW